MADVSINERATVKKLVVCGSDEVRYEMSAGKMIELNIASGGGVISTADNLNMFEAFQKVFIVNGAYLRVADFVNTKLTLSGVLTTPPARGETITQLNSDATMIVDFVSAGLNEIYGYVTKETFTVNAADTLSSTSMLPAATRYPTGINGMLTHTALGDAHDNGQTITQAASGAEMVVEHTDATRTHTWGQITKGTFIIDSNVTGGTGSTFKPTVVDTSPPVWHGWTVYPDGTSGTMPTKAYLGCLYRGRNVLAGNPNYPHQWYMSKIGNPWDWLYASIDPLTAAAGNNADAGETGDIIRALIPYKDDYLIFGCANTIWVLTGDPAAGGEIDEVDLTVGMFGANSWCFDGDGNLYFWGTNGIYKIPLGFRSVENLTEISLPDLVAEQVGDINVTPATHRITMAYDRKRHGILICITRLSNGSNSNYWYDLKLGGFFPESYPIQCGAYSLFYYAANDPAYADLLVGCKDGYIRKFESAAAGKDDDTGGSTAPISSYVVWPIQHLTEDNDKQGKLTSLTVELSGGLATTKLTHTELTTIHAKGDTLTQAVTGATMIVAFSNAAKTLTFGHSTTGVFTATANDITGSGSGTTFQATAVGTGAFTDTDGVSYEIHIGDDAETVIEKIKDGVAPHSSGILSNSGKKNRIRTRVRGAWLGIKFLNSEDTESWAINKVYGTIKGAGTIK